ncbi:branched-chain amino acid aminotransferase, partial [Candidatus Riflebacteria bacterium]
SMNIDWDSLTFSYKDTNCNIRFNWKDGNWDNGELCREPYIRLHMAATVLHYGQAAFEGLKVFSGKDGKFRLFRGDENAKRLANSAKRLVMPVFPEEKFLDAVHKVVAANIEYIPPYGTGGALYVRPVLYGTSPKIGVQPAEEYTLIIMVMPVGPYYKGGITPVEALIVDGFDRAAPMGVGNVKVAGNYAAALEPGRLAKQQGYPINLFLDAKEHKYIDEFGTSNFIGITKDGSYVTPVSSSILPSITNKSLMYLAEQDGRKVERRPIALDDLTNYAEIGATGTAVVITPICKVVYGDRVFEVGPKDHCPPVFQGLYNKVQAIQYGESEAPEGWISFIET